MKPIKPILKPLFYLIPVVAAFFIFLSTVSFAQSKSPETVKVKIVKTVDGKTTTIEKTMEEASVKDFTKQFEDIKGENVQVMITVESTDPKGKHSCQSSCSSSCTRSGKGKCASSMNFNFDM